MKLNLKTADKEHQVAGLSLDDRIFLRTGKKQERKKKLTNEEINKKGITHAADKLFKKHYLDQ